MTHSEQEEILRRALHAVADSIEPAPDGLERIRERLSKPRPLAVAWLMAGWTGLAQPLLLRMEPVLAGAAGRLSDRLAEWLRLMIRSLGAAGERLRPAGVRLRRGLERLRPVGEMLVDAIRMLRPGSGMSRHEKLRSALAFGAAALIGVAGGLALSNGVAQSMFAAVSTLTGGTQNKASGPGAGSPQSNSAQTYGQKPGTTPHSTLRPSPGQNASCSPTSKPGTHPSPAPSGPAPTTPAPTTPAPTTPAPTTPTPTIQTSAGPRFTPAGINASADVGSSSSATNPAPPAGGPSPGEAHPGANTAPTVGVSATPHPSATGCGGA